MQSRRGGVGYFIKKSALQREEKKDPHVEDGTRPKGGISLTKRAGGFRVWYWKERGLRGKE